MNGYFDDRGDFLKFMEFGFVVSDSKSVFGFQDFVVLFYRVVDVWDYIFEFGLVYF